MALVLDISINSTNNCSQLSINELTGIYDEDLNIGGYNAPNPTVASVTAWSLVITRPDASIITITSPVGLPTSNTALEYLIPSTTLNATWTKLQDGIYTIVYSVTSDDIIYTVTKTILISCNIECCVAKLFAKIATDTLCECNSITVKNALYADALLQGLLANKSCGNTTAINKLLVKLNKICVNTSNCGCNQ